MQLFLVCICGHISVMCCHLGMSQSDTEDCYLLSACGVGRYILGVFPICHILVEMGNVSRTEEAF